MYRKIEQKREKKKSKAGKRWRKSCEKKFLPLDYAQTIFHRFQNLKQNLSTVEELTNEFYQLSIHVDLQETDEQLAARYVNCLKFSIQDELSMHRVHNVEEE